MSEIIKRKRLLTFDMRKRIWERDEKLCRLCKRETVLFKAHCGNMYDKGYKPLAAIDHIYPFSKGGKCEESNYQLLCWRCNSIKGAKTPEAA